MCRAVLHCSASPRSDFDMQRHGILQHEGSGSNRAADDDLTSGFLTHATFLLLSFSMNPRSSSVQTWEPLRDLSCSSKTFIGGFTDLSDRRRPPWTIVKISR